MTLKPYLQLMRPANIITALADILAGFAVVFFIYFSAYFSSYSGVTYEGVYYLDSNGLPTDPPNLGNISLNLLWLLLATIGLYGGGVVMNDVFDAELDAVERPERPIPSGRVSKQSAATLGLSLLLLGIVAAWVVSLTSGLIALTVALLAVIYDRYGKHTVLGPINMGMCRGGNLVLGMTAALKSQELLELNLFEAYGILALIPIIYIAAITTISRGEVHGGNKSALYLAFVLYALVIGSIAALSVLNPLPFWHSLPFLALFAYLIFPPLLRAFRDRQPRNIGLAVKAGVISLIVMDAAIAATYAGWAYGLLVLALLPVSRYLARIFAVT